MSYSSKLYFRKMTITLRILSLFVLLLTLFSCATKRVAESITGKHTIESQCPPYGTCAFEVLKDKSLGISIDETNRTHYTIIDTPGKSVVSYKYSKTQNPEYKDDFYSEEIVFETDDRFSNLTGEGEHNIYFTVQCFCRGKAGTYRLVAATATFKNNGLHIKLPTNIIDNQRLKDIDVSFK
jgi:hypothetical protein